VHPIVLTAAALPYGSLADPPGTSVLTAALSWVEGTLLGSVAVSAAIIATAVVGFMMLSGRMRVRPALAVLLGSFILFGASTIAAGLRSSGGDYSLPGEVYPAPSPPPAVAPSAAPPVERELPRDPYAGASVPTE
jgi:type IV secretory pathway VirB2 component (pilin)